MKKLFLLIPFFLFSSCIVLDINDNLGSTTWVGISGNPYSVSFGSSGDKATFTFNTGFSQTASYLYEVDFGGYNASLYRLDYGKYDRYYYAFYRSGDKLYGNANSNPNSSFHYLRPEYVAYRR